MYKSPLLWAFKFKLLNCGLSGFSNNWENNSVRGEAFTESSINVSVKSMYIIQCKSKISA